MPAFCRTLLTQGSCHIPNCRYEHNIVRSCSTCNVICSDARGLRAHINGNRHKKVVRGPILGARCMICNINLNDARDWPSHSHGRRHVDLAATKGLDPDDEEYMEEGGVARNTVVCEICHLFIPRSAWERHLATAGHQRRKSFISFQVALEEAGKDKNGVVIAHGETALVDFGVLDINSPSPSVTSLPIIINLTTRTGVRLMEHRISSSIGRHPISAPNFTTSGPPGPALLPANRPLTIQVQFHQFNIRGHYEDRVELVFFDISRNLRFTIVRSVQAIVGVKADQELLGPTAPYVRPETKPRDPEGEVIPGVPPDALAAITWKVSLPRYPVPDKISEAVMMGSTEQRIKRARQTLLPQSFSCQTYARHWHTLLHIEEEQLKVNLQVYDKEDVPLDKNGPFFTLVVPGLAERRPSLIVGDIIHVQEHAISSDQWFGGYVHVTEDYSVALKFATSFNSIRGERYDVRFSLSRGPLRRMHQSLDTACPARLLFPKPSHRHITLPTNQTDALSLFNRNIEQNPHQSLAVRSILHLPRGSPPFIVFGPPGTGKTITIVEAIKQIISQSNAAFVLACAPSNSAADLIASRLLNIPGSQRRILRMNAPSRPKKLQLHELEAYSRFDEDTKVFHIPNLDILKGFQVVVSTCVSAWILHGIGVNRGHFTHIFIDEAGQPSEPEAMIAIKTMAGPNTNVILSGDPKQLGPIVHSPVADKLGMGVSYLDRLMMLPDMYEPHESHGITIVKLVKNYRSHPYILKYPNDRFYEGELEAVGPKEITESLLHWTELPKKGFPIMFHSISGKDMRQGSSPSYFNPHEVSIVKHYVDALLSDRKLGLAARQIGIISPYNAQCTKIRELLPSGHLRYRELKIGSTEEFQGQERRVIIVSTVRSSEEHVSFDIKHTLGFVANPRRFNVAMTRAQALLIVVGDPGVLFLDPLWRCFLNYIHRSGGWKGKAIHWNPLNDESEVDFLKEREDQAKNMMDSLLERLKDHVLDGREGDEAIERPWREDE